MKKILVIALAILGLASVVFRSGAQQPSNPRELSEGSRTALQFKNDTDSGIPSLYSVPIRGYSTLTNTLLDSYYFDIAKTFAKFTKVAGTTNRLTTVNGVDMREFLKLAREFAPENPNPTREVVMGSTSLLMMPQPITKAEQLRNEASRIKAEAAAIEEREKRLKRYLEMLAKIEEVVR